MPSRQRSRKLRELGASHIRRRFPGPIAPRRSYFPIATPIRASKRHTDLGTTTVLDCDPSDHSQESPDPPGPNRKKNSLKKNLFGGLQKSSRKYPKESRKEDFLGHFKNYSFFFFSGTFLQTPTKTSFEIFFFGFGPGGSGDSCKWLLGSQDLVLDALGCLRFPVSGHWQAVSHKSQDFLRYWGIAGSATVLTSDLECLPVKR